jgi:hypothetical protein
LHQEIAADRIERPDVKVESKSGARKMDAREKGDAERAAEEEAASEARKEHEDRERAEKDLRAARASPGGSRT